MNKNQKYFPERFLENRHFSNKMLRDFKNSDLEIDYTKDVDVYHELREFIRKPVPEWKDTTQIPKEFLTQQENILSRLKEKTYNLPENPTKSDLDKYAEVQIDLMKTDVWKEWSDLVSQSKEYAVTFRKLEQETKNARELIRFFQNGRNIFEISPFLIKLLENTEVGNIRFKDFVLPYNTMYLHFGGIEGVEYPPESYEEKFDAYLSSEFNFETDEEEDMFYENKKFLLDGAYVSKTQEKSIDIMLCFKDPKDNFEKRINIVDDHRFPTFEFTLSFGKWNPELGRTDYDVDLTFNESVVVFSDIWDENADIGEINYSKLVQLIREPDNCGQSEWEEYVLMDKALKLIVNCICYLNSTDKDVEISSTDEHASKLLEQLGKTKKSQEISKLKLKLEKQSYSKIHFLGNNLKKNFLFEKSENELEPHWRRGHWRNQPFGKNLSDSKLIWIKPTIVRKDKGEPEKGHIYDI